MKVRGKPHRSAPGRRGVAVDGAGNACVVTSQYWVVQIPPAGPVPARQSISPSCRPTKIAVDSSGDIYVVDVLNDRVVKSSARTHPHWRLLQRTSSANLSGSATTRRGTSVPICRNGQELGRQWH